MRPPPPKTHVAPIEPQYEETKFDRKHTAIRSCLSYGWDITKAFHGGMLSINDSLKWFPLRMQEPRAPFKLVPTQDKFISYVEWPNNRPFNYGWGSYNVS